MTTTNQGGIIKAATQGSAQSATKAPATPSAIMRNIVNSESTMKILQNSLKENAGAFAASIVDLYNSDKTLQQCDPAKVMGEALKAVSLKLPINKQLGFAYIVPYRDKGVQVPQFQIGYKGYIQLCMRSGVYKCIHADAVREGELVGIDRLSGNIDLSGAATSDTIVGYFAYIETLNGFKKCLYWSKEQVSKHARRYSKSFSSQTSAWATNFDEMAQKTVLRNLLSHYGLMSVELQNALVTEDYSESTSPEPEATASPEGAITADYDIADADIDADTGEVLNAN